MPNQHFNPPPQSFSMRHMPSQNIGSHQPYQGSYTPSARHMYHPGQAPQEGSFYQPVRSEKIVERRRDKASKGGKKGKKNFGEMQQPHMGQYQGYPPNFQGGPPGYNPYGQPPQGQMNPGFMGPPQPGMGSIRQVH